MGKKKNKNKPTTNPYWANVGYLQGGLPRFNLIKLNKGASKNQQFQAPHHQQDSMMDLTDDTSPNNPMSNSKGNPGKSYQEQMNQKKKLANEPIFDTTEDFTEDVSPSGGDKLGESSDNKASSSTTEIDRLPNKIVNEPKKGVVQGFASKIKLVAQGSKTVTVTTSSPANEQSKPIILAAETITSKSHPTPRPNLTIKGVQQPAIKVEEIPKAGPNLKIKGVQQAAIKVEEIIPKGAQINTRVTRVLNKMPPQQYIAATQPQTALLSTPIPQNPVQQYNIPRNSHPPTPLLTNPSPVQVYNIQNNPHPTSCLYHQNYPKGIPRSFLINPTGQTPQPYSNQPQKPNVVEYAYSYNPNNNQGYNETAPLYVNTEAENNPAVQKQAYSPSDVYADNLLGTTIDGEEEGKSNGSQSPDLCESGEKRLSAFKRLGPLAQPKKPKLTINLLYNKDQAVREVVDETEVEVEPKYVPVHLRPEIMTSTDETVMKFLVFWPWKKPLAVRKTVTFRNSKSVMILEQEQMIEIYDRNNTFLQVTVKGYPPSWNKEKVLDTLLDTLNGKPFIPCFIEFTEEECKFLVIRSRSALTLFHKIGFIIRNESYELHITIAQTDLTLNDIEFIPKIILKKRVVAAFSGERSLDLSNFTTQEDVSHFIYFPLNRLNNQIDIIQQQSPIVWENLTELNLSHNRLTSIEGFNLTITTPKLKYLDLSFNYLEKVTFLIRYRSLALRTLKLEGNPLCNDYTDPSHYVKVLKLMFPALVEIDGIPIKLPGDMPPFKKNYCPEAATDLIEKFLEIYFPLLDAIDEDREAINELYHERASMTITTRYKLRYGPIFKSFRSLFHRARVMDEGSLDSIDGAKDIAKVIAKWPPLKHDPFTFNVDVMLHDDFVTIFKVGGLVRLTAETLAEDEHLLAFTRTFVLHSFDGIEYKIANEMVYWDEPTEEYAHTAFQVTVKPKRLSLKLASAPDDNLKKQLVEIFANLTEANKSISEKCLEQKEWNLKSALENYVKLVKLEDLESITKELNVL